MYEMDFSSVTNEGRYFVRVPGVGRSREFRIAASAAEDAFRVHMSGLYQKRCGIAKTEPYTHWTIWRRWGNLENQTVAASEYTVWETIAPAASVTGYLAAPSNAKACGRPPPAADVRDLPGYWPLP